MTAITTLDPGNPAHLADPYPAWAEARATGRPVYIRPLNAWAITGHELVCAVLRDPATYSSVPSPGAQRELAELRTSVPHACPEDNIALVNSDPPGHTRLRKIAQKLLTPRAVAAHEPMIRRIADGLIDEFADTRRADIVGEFAVPLTLTVICRIIGIDEREWRQVKRWSDDLVRLHMAGLDEHERAALVRSSVEFHGFVGALADKRAAHPAGDLVSALLEAQIEGEPALAEEQIIGAVVQLTIGGHETLTALIARCALILAENPTLRTSLASDLSLAPGIIEEALRHRSPVKGMTRTATRDVELGGQLIRAGARLLVLFGAANRDPSRFADPDRFDLERSDVGRHLAFGKGVHFCIGAPLARLEARVALEQIVQRLPGLRLADGRGPDQYLRSFIVHGLESLEVAWD